MDLIPFSSGQARVWSHDEPRFGAVGVWTERVAGLGEDADPLLVYRRSTGRGLVAVFDGVGGAGRIPAGHTADGHERTQAWVASRRVRALTEEWFAGSSKIRLGEHIADRLPGVVAEDRRIRGTIRREFPSTLAALDFQVDAHSVGWDVLWAGDSRCYVAEPDHGLQQLSRDDTAPSDALELLVQDPPMTNMVSADRPFALNHWRGGTRLPCVLVCATDGCFGYVVAPALFEHVLLSTLMTAGDFREWAEALADRIGGYTGDDASLAVAVLGFGSFADVRTTFRDRAERLRREHAEPLDGVSDDDRAALVAARERSWLQYRNDYERRLLGVRGPA